LNFHLFDRTAHELYAEIPAEYRAGVAGLRVLPDAHHHPDFPDVFTMGECVTEAFPSSFDGPETIQSFIIVYHGSFAQLAKGDPEFDWEGQLWETLVHELQHHLESLAGQDDLEEIDYAMDEDFKRARGEPFDPWYYQRGTDLGGGAFEVEGRGFLELEWDPNDPPDEIDFDWDGRTYRVPFPEGVPSGLRPTGPSGGRTGGPTALGDVHFLEVWRLPDDASVDLVLIQKRGIGSKLKRALTRDRLSTTISRADAVLVS